MSLVKSDLLGSVFFNSFLTYKTCWQSFRFENSTTFFIIIKPIGVQFFVHQTFHTSKTSLAVKFKTTHKPAKPPTVKLNHPQSSQTTHKPAKSPTNHPNHPQTIQTTQKPPTNQLNYSKSSQIPNKSPTNQPKIGSFFPWRYFLWTTTISLPIPRKERNGCIFLMFLLDFAFRLLHCTTLYHP